jgi:hypothetical protein
VCWPGGVSLENLSLQSATSANKWQGRLSIVDASSRQLNGSGPEPRHTPDLLDALGSGRRTVLSGS